MMCGRAGILLDACCAGHVRKKGTLLASSPGEFCFEKRNEGERLQKMHRSGFHAVA